MSTNGLFMDEAALSLPAPLRKRTASLLVGTDKSWSPSPTLKACRSFYDKRRLQREVFAASPRCANPVHPREGLREPAGRNRLRNIKGAKSVSARDARTPGARPGAPLGSLAA